MAEFVALSELLKAVRNAVAGNKSGAFFITSRDQHSAMITLQRGRITGVKYRNVRGYEAARIIAGIDTVRFQTGAEPTELPGEEPLDTQTVLGTLEAVDAERVPTPGPASEGGGEEVDPAQLDRVRERYIAAIGPIGGALFDEEYEAMGREAHARAGYARLIERLAEQIDDHAEAEGFRNDVSLR